MKKKLGGIVLQDCIITLEPRLTLKRRPLFFIFWFIIRAVSFTGNAVSRPADIVIWDPQRKVRIWKEGPYRSPSLDELLVQFENEINSAGIWSFIANRRKYWAT
jgi:hypothetical protein